MADVVDAAELVVRVELSVKARGGGGREGPVAAAAALAAAAVACRTDDVVEAEDDPGP